METIFDKEFNAIGNIDKAEGCGWFAYVGNWEDGEQQQAFFKYKNQAISHIKKENKNGKANKLEV